MHTVCRALFYNSQKLNLITMPVGASADPVVVGQLEDGPDGGEGMVLIVDELVGSGLDICSR